MQRVAGCHKVAAQEGARDSETSSAATVSLFLAAIPVTSRSCTKKAINAELTFPCGASAKESGMSSAKTIQVMQPAAKPRARGNRKVKVSTNMKEGTASRG